MPKGKPLPAAVEAALVKASSSEVLASFEKFCSDLQATPANDLTALWNQISSAPAATRDLRRTCIINRMRQDAVEQLYQLCRDVPTRRRAIKLWSRLSPDEVYAWAQTQPPELKAVAAEYAARAKADENPLAALSWVDAGKANSGAQADLFQKLAYQNFEMALTTISEIKDPAARQAGWRNCGMVIAKQKPGESLAWARALSEPTDRANALYGVISALYSTQPDTALRALREDRPAGKGWPDELLRKVLRSVASGNPDAAIAWINDPQNQVAKPREMLRFTVIASNSNASPQQMGGFLEAVRPAQKEAADNISVLSSWKPADLQAAFQETLGLPDSKAKSEMLSHLGFHLVQAHKPLPEGLLTAMSDEARMTYLAPLGRQLRDEGRIAEMAELFKLMPNPGKNWNSFFGSPEVFVMSYPALAIPFHQALPKEVAAEVVDQLVQGLGNTDYAEGLKFLASLQDQNQKDYYGLANYAAMNSDPDFVSQQILKMPAGEMRDSSLAGLVDAIVDDDPPSALAWASATSNPSTRIHNLAMTLSKIQTEEHEDGLKAFEQLKLTPQDRAAVLKMAAGFNK